MKFKLKEYYFRIPEQELIDSLLAVSKKLGKETITMNEYLDHGKYHPRTLQNRFKSWYNAMKRAGLKPCRLPVALDESLLFENLKQVWLKLGAQPDYKKMKAPLSRYSATTYINHFGTWMDALRRFIEYENSKPAGNRLSRKPLRLLIPHFRRGGDIPGSKQNNKDKKKKIKLSPRGISLKLRFSVFVRDGFRCMACGNSPITQPGIKLHCDHIMPWSKGGKTVFDNLRTLCAECNIGRGNRMEG